MSTSFSRFRGMFVGGAAAILACGCVSTHLTTYDDGRPTMVDSRLQGKPMSTSEHALFPCPVFVFNPPSRVFYDNDLSTSYEAALNSSTNTSVISDGIQMTDSYVTLANWCHVSRLLGSPFTFVVIDERTRVKDEYGMAALVGCLTAGVVPFPIFYRCRCLLRSYYSMDQGVSVRESNGGERFYGFRGEKYMSVLSPLGLFVPPYRKQYFAAAFSTGSSPTCLEIKNSLIRPEKPKYVYAALTEFSNRINADKQTARIPSQEEFEAVYNKVFGCSFVPGRAHMLVVDFETDPQFFLTSKVEPGGTVLKSGIGEPQSITLREDHLYLTSYKSVFDKNRSSREVSVFVNVRTVRDLGRIQDLSCVLAAWHIQRGANTEKKH